MTAPYASAAGPGMEPDRPRVKREARMDEKKSITTRRAYIRSVIDNDLLDDLPSRSALHDERYQAALRRDIEGQSRPDWTAAERALGRNHVCAAAKLAAKEQVLGFDPEDEARESVAESRANHERDWTEDERKLLHENRRKATTPISAPIPMAAKDAAPVIPERFVQVCSDERTSADAIVQHADKRLAYVRDDGAWLTFQLGAGWNRIHDDVILARVAAFGRENYGTQNKKTGEVTMHPRTGGRAATAAGIMRVLKGLIGSDGDEWDSNPAVVGIAGGDVLNLTTGARRRMMVIDKLRRRLSAAPATPDEYNRSIWKLIVEHVIPDPAERNWVQQTLGAALMKVSTDALVWIFGDAGCGKGVLIEGLRTAFGTYAVSIPAGEVQLGGGRGHTQWRHRLHGARLMLLDDAPNRDLDTSVINSLLGSVMTANAMRRGSVDFRVDAPLLATANREPTVPAADPGFRRRLKPIACGPAIPDDEQDPAVRTAMRSEVEQAAIVRWLLDGASASARAPATVPESVRQRVRDVLEAAPMTEFTETFEPGETVTADEVWRRWQCFKSDRGERPGGRRALTTRLKSDYEWTPSKGGKGVRTWNVPARYATYATLAPPVAPPVNPLKTQGATDLGGAGGARSGVSPYARATRTHDAHVGPKESLRHLRHPDNLGESPAGALDGIMSGENQAGAPPAGEPKNPETVPPHRSATRGGRRGCGDRRDRAGAPPAPPGRKFIERPPCRD